MADIRFEILQHMPNILIAGRYVVLAGKILKAFCINIDYRDITDIQRPNLPDMDCGEITAADYCYLHLAPNPTLAVPDNVPPRNLLAAASLTMSYHTLSWPCGREKHAHSPRVKIISLTILAFAYFPGAH